MTAADAPEGPDAADPWSDLPCGVLLVTPDGTVTRASTAVGTWLGRADVVGGRLTDLLTPSARLLWHTHHGPRLARDGALTGVSLDLRTADGERVSVIASARTDDDAADLDRTRPIRLAMVRADERLAYETRLVDARVAAEQAVRRTRVLQRATEACSGSVTTDDLLDNVVTALTTDASTLGAAIWLPTRDGRLVLQAADGLGATALTTLADAVHGGALHQAWRTGEPHQVRAGDPDARDLSCATALVLTGADRLLAVSVRDGAEHHGTLALLLAQDAPEDPEDVSVHRTLGALLGQALTRTRLHARLQHDSLHDALTGLANRVLVTRALATALARSHRAGTSLALLLVDLDGFKAVNDTWGHGAGDALLVATAERLRHAVRPHDLVGRLGGDEFVVLVEDVDDGEAEVLADRVRRSLARPVAVDGATVAVTASVGVVVQAGTSPAEVSTLLTGADDAMYEAKRAGKDRHVLRREPHQRELSWASSRSASSRSASALEARTRPRG